MFMGTGLLLVVLGVVLLFVVGLVVAAIVLASNRTNNTGTGTSSSIPQQNYTQMMAPEARVERGERTSSLVSEQIEQMVKRRIGGYLDKHSLRLDFGTVPSGGVAFWLNDQRYDDIEAIPDGTIRQAIREAVAEFNE